MRRLRLEHFGVTFALAVHHLIGAGGFQAFHLGFGRQIGQRLVVERDDFAEIDRRVGDLLALAELAVGEKQVVEVDALERLSPPRRSPFGSSIAVEIRSSRLTSSMSNALRMLRAAVAQALRHHLAVAHRVELGFDLVRLRRDLTHRQRGRENLDQNCVHHHDRGGPGRFRPSLPALR